jgi:hypothetical protein
MPVRRRLIFGPLILGPLARRSAASYQRPGPVKGGSVSQKGKIEHPAPRLVTAWPPIRPSGRQPDATLVLCPFLAALDPATAFWLGALAWHDANASLLAAIGTPARVSQPVYAGVFCVDPFRRDGDLFAALRRAGIGGIINLPTVSVIDGDLSNILGSFALGIQREIDFLRRAREAGFNIAACVGTTEAADHAVAAGADFLIAHGGPPLPGQADPAHAATVRLQRRFVSGPAVVSVTELLTRVMPAPAGPRRVPNRR